MKIFTIFMTCVALTLANGLTNNQERHDYLFDSRSKDVLNIFEKIFPKIRNIQQRNDLILKRRLPEEETKKEAYSLIDLQNFLEKRGHIW